MKTTLCVSVPLEFTAYDPIALEVMAIFGEKLDVPASAMYMELSESLFGTFWI